MISIHYFLVFGIALTSTSILDTLGSMSWQFNALGCWPRLAEHPGIDVVFGSRPRPPVNPGVRTVPAHPQYEMRSTWMLYIVIGNNKFWYPQVSIYSPVLNKKLHCKSKRNNNYANFLHFSWSQFVFLKEILIII